VACSAITEKGAKEAYAFHNVVGVPAKVALVRDGVSSCASTGMAIYLKGKSAHASEPENGRNPIRAINEIVAEIYRLEKEAYESGMVDFGGGSDKTVLEKGILTVLCVNAGGDEYGISPADGVIRLVCRTVKEVDRLALTDKIEKFSKDIASKYGLGVEIGYTESFPELVCHKKAADKIRAAAKNAGFETMDMPLVRGSEDFAHFTRLVPGAMVVMGGTQSSVAGIHTESYDFDDTIIEPMVDLYVEIAKLPMIQ
jgi:metal-dependent amidase/aminoacylase/carboxypeptidase family protein